jgi:hypothetical protein
MEISCVAMNKRNNTIPIYQIDSDEALIIMGGFTATVAATEGAAAYFRKNGDYQVFNADFQSKDGLSICVHRFKQYLSEIEMGRYKKVHFFCYIMGGMVLSEFLKQESIPNLGRIVLDRGPLQEQVPIVTIKSYPDVFMRKIWGQTLFDLATTDYRSFANCNAEIGLIIETKPSKLVLFHINQVLNADKLSFEPDTIMNGYKDYTYIPFDHDEMYSRIEEYGSLVRCFLKTGTFGENANRHYSGKIEGIRFYHDCVSCGIGACSGCLFFIH